MATTKAVSLSGLARRLVDDGLVAEDKATEALTAAKSEKIPFVTYVVREGMANSRDVAVAAADEFGVPLLDLGGSDPESLPKELVDEKLVRQHHTLPLFRRGNRLYVAVSDPTNLLALDEIKFHTGLSTEAILVEEDKLAAAIDKFLQSAEDALTDLSDGDLDDLDLASQLHRHGLHAVTDA